jgi:hypothetical protein
MKGRRVAQRHADPGRLAARALLLVLPLLGLSSPARGYNVYYANLHSHTALSDGIGTPDEAFAYARDVAGIQVLAITDHTHMLSPAEFNQLLSAADAYTQNGVFVALGAQEFGNLNDFGHINIFDCAYRNPNPTDNLLATYSFIRTQGAFGGFNHPIYGTNFNDLTFYPEYVDAIKAIEIRNGIRATGYDAQYIQALNNGWKVGPLADQDNHEGHWGDQQNPQMGYRIFLNGILADSLTREEILGALRARRFYAMEVDPPSDRIELDFRCDGSPMGSDVVTGCCPLFTAHARAVNGVSLFNRVELFRDGVVYDTRMIVGVEIDYQFRDQLADGASHYYFVRVSQVDSDQCWSSPVWVRVEVDPAAVAGRPPRLLAPVLRPRAGGTEIRFLLPDGEDRQVSFTIHDISGRAVRRLGPRVCSPGEQSWLWDGRDDEGFRLGAGVYFGVLDPAGLERVSARLVFLP